MDKDLEKIRRRAGMDKPKPEKPKTTEKVFPKNTPYDRLVFTKLVVFSAFYPVIFGLIVPAIICLGFLISGFERETIGTLLIYAALVLLYLLMNAIRYRFQFVGWQERLPFTLRGWNEIIHEKKMFCDLCWNHARIEIVLRNADAELLELTAASLTIFARKSKKAFYTRKIGSSSTHNRQDWKLISPTVAEGSANPEVMRYMKNTFERELATIARKTGKISAVEVILLSEEFQIDIEIRTGNT